MTEADKTTEAAKKPEAQEKPSPAPQAETPKPTEADAKADDGQDGRRGTPSSGWSRCSGSSGGAPSSDRKRRREEAKLPSGRRAIRSAMAAVTGAVSSWSGGDS